MDICSHKQKNFQSIYNASIPRTVKYITLENTASLTILTFNAENYDVQGQTMKVKLYEFYTLVLNKSDQLYTMGDLCQTRVIAIHWTGD